MSQLFANAARAPLSSSISNVDTSLTVPIGLCDLFPVANTNGSAVPTVGLDYFKVVLQDTSGAIEIVYIRTRASGVAIMSNLLRGQEGTTAIAFAAGSVVGLRHTAVDLADAVDLAATASVVGKAVLSAATVIDQRTALEVAPRATRIDVASAAGPVSLSGGALNTDDIRITGSAVITAFTVTVGRVIRVTAGGAFTLTNNSSIVTQRGTSIFCSTGDTFMLRATAANTVEVLNYVSSSVVVVRAYNSVSTAMATAVFTKIDFQTEVEDTAGVFAASRLTANVAGDYMISAAYQPGAAPVACTMSIYKNGARHSDGCITSDASILCSSTVSTNVYLAIGDYVEIYGYQNSGGPQGTGIGATATWFSAILLQRR